MNRYFKKVDIETRRLKTTNPFEICDLKDIWVEFEPLGSINGYTTILNRINSIHINSDLNDIDRIFICAHELGHIVCRHKTNTLYLSAKTFINTNKAENQANLVATHLLLKSYKKFDFTGYTLDQISCMTGIRKIYLQQYYSLFYKFF